MLSDCVWGSEAAAVRPASLWQLKLANFVSTPDSLVGQPCFDWRMYASMPWAGQNTLWGMELSAEDKIPRYSQCDTGDWAAKSRFLCCFVGVGGSVVRCWTELQLRDKKRTIDFFDLIGNGEVSLRFANLVYKSMQGAVSETEYVDFLKLKAPWRLKQQGLEYGNIESAADRRAFAQQELDDPKAFRLDLSAWMVLSWAVEFMPYKQSKIVRKARWKSLGTSIREQLAKTAPAEPAEDWLGQKDLLPDDIATETAWKAIYRKALDPNVNSTNGASSPYCLQALDAMNTLLAETAVLYDKDLDDIRDVLLGQASARVLNIFAQCVMLRVCENRNYQMIIKSNPKLLLKKWVASQID